MNPAAAHPLSQSELSALDRRSLFHPFTQLGEHERNGPPVVMTSAEGCTLTDANGKSYLDALAGLWCVNIGFGREEMADAISDQVRKLSYAHNFSSMGSEPPIVLADRILRMAPRNMSKVFFGNSGSDANDTQVKLVWYYNNARGLPNKKKIIARRRGYHGVTLVTAGLTGLPGLHKGFDVPLPFIRHTKPPHRLWEGHGLSDSAFTELLMDDLERLIAEEGADTIGAMIAEPIMAAGGVITPPDGYFAALQDILRKNDILLIADEVVCGFGRLGANFGSDVYGIEPDLITAAKGITSAYVPLSACIVSEKVWRVLVDAGNELGAFGHGYTYTAHPVAAAAALANLDILEGEGLMAQASERGAYLHERLQAAFVDHPLVGEVRGRDLIGAVEFVKNRERPEKLDPSLKTAPRVVKAMLDRGVISRALPDGDTIAFSPPFIVSQNELDRMVEVAREAADQVTEELRRDGVSLG
jgi:L-2,4-diaminobutyrate transaminase